MSNKPEKEKSTVIEYFSQSLPIISALLLVASLIYDYAFLWALGLSFNDIPSSISEHIRSAILWSPAAFLYLIIIILYELLIRLSYNGMSEEEILSKKYDAIELRKIKRKQNNIVYGLFIAGTIYYTFVATDDSWMYLSFMAAYAFIFGLVSTNANMEKLLASRISRILFLAPFFLTMLGNTGFGAGKELLNSKKIIWELNISQKDEVTALKFIGLRRFSEFTIAIAENQNISIIPNGSILNARMLKQIEPKISNACKWFNLTCEVVKK